MFLRDKGNISYIIISFKFELETLFWFLFKMAKLIVSLLVCFYYFVNGIEIYKGNDTNSIHTCGYTGSTFTIETFNIRNELKLISSSNIDGCNDISYDNNLKLMYKNSIILISRGTCTFADKIYYAQKLGAIGVIIGNNHENEPNCKLTMSISDNDKRNFTIPSVFISYNDYNLLKNYISTYDNIQVSMNNNNYDTYTKCDTQSYIKNRYPKRIKTFGVFIFISIPTTWFLIICCGILKRKCVKYRKKKKRQTALKKIPIIKYQSKIKKNTTKYEQLLGT